MGKKLPVHRHLLVCVFVLTCSWLSAQDSDFDLISRHRPGFMWYYAGINPPDTGKVRKYDRLIFDINYCDWTGKDVKPFKVKPLSIGFNTNLMFDVLLNRKNTFSFGWGFRYSLYRIEMKDYLYRDDQTNSTQLKPDILSMGIDRSIFKAHSIGIPIEMRFRGAKWRHAKFMLGGALSWRFMGTTVLSSKYKDVNNMHKTRGFFDLNPLDVEAHIRFGIRNWALYAAYHFLPLFKNSNSTQLNQIQLGLSISLF